LRAELLLAKRCLRDGPVSEVRAASEGDLVLVRQLLEAAGLPTADLIEARPEFTVLTEGGRIVAAGALERFGPSALLRSVVVVADRRGTGLGGAVVRELEARARATQIDCIVLLTQSAPEFFIDQGYQAIERTDAPVAVQASGEFRSLCPASAICMMKLLAA
jgi:amino-acid N-acetyltransferase